MSNELQIAALLLEHRSDKEDWGDISGFENQPCPKRIANKFLLCCLLDWQMDSGLAWRNGERLVKDILGNPNDIWRAITSVSETEWKSRYAEYKLHRFPAGHQRLWRIGAVILDKYDGDAARIWQGKELSPVLVDLLALGAGEQISRMIVGALRDCRQIRGSNDLKADMHVCRVLGRAFQGEPANPAVATELARQLDATDPWQLDWPLWNIGKSYCRPSSPDCERCYLAPHCAYARSHSQ